MLSEEKKPEEKNAEEPKTTLRALLGDFVPDCVDFYTVCRYAHEDGAAGIEQWQTVSYGDCEPAKSDEAADCFGSDLLSGSDYNGGALARSNVESMLALIEEADEEHEDAEPFPYFQASGGYGTFALFFVLDAERPESMLAPIVEALQALDSYPVLDEEHFCETEHEDEENAWESYAERDFVGALESRIGSPYLCEVDFDGTGTDAGEVFRFFAERGNVNGGTGVVHEECGPYFMAEEVAEAMHPALLFFVGATEIDGREALKYASEPSEEDANEARRILRLAGIGACLKTLAGTLGEALFEWRLVERKRERGEKPEPIAAGLSDEALAAMRGEAKRRAREIVLGATIEAGDCDSPLALDSWESEPIRRATITLERFDWPSRETRTVSFEVDPRWPHKCGDRAALLGLRKESESL